MYDVPPGASDVKRVPPHTRWLEVPLLVSLRGVKRKHSESTRVAYCECLGVNPHSSCYLVPPPRLGCKSKKLIRSAAPAILRVAYNLYAQHFTNVAYSVVDVKYAVWPRDYAHGKGSRNGYRGSGAQRAICRCCTRVQVAARANIARHTGQASDRQLRNCARQQHRRKQGEERWRAAGHCWQERRLNLKCQQTQGWKKDSSYPLLRFALCAGNRVRLQGGSHKKPLTRY